MTGTPERDDWALTEVRRAAAALDADAPGWASRVNMDLLNLRDLRFCVLGQVYRRRWWQVWRLDGFGYGQDRLGRWTHTKDLHWPVFAAHDRYCPAWRTVIAERTRPA